MASTNCYAFDVNDAGTAVGRGTKFGNRPGVVGTFDQGQRAIRWDAGGTAPTELGTLGTDTAGYTYNVAYAVSSSGTAVGYAEKFSGGTYFGSRAVRWDAGGVAATELASLGANGGGGGSSEACAVNTSGTTVGYSVKYASGIFVGNRAVRWDAGTSAATELGHLGTANNASTTSRAFAINDAGTAVGYAEKYSGAKYLGVRAVRWDGSTTAATELGNLGTDGDGATSTFAYAVNSAGISAGYADKYTDVTYVGNRAACWGLNGIAIDLNTLLSPDDAAHWTLFSARGINDTNWISGLGSYDPDGASGPLDEYQRAFLIQLPTAVPEPATLLSLLAASSGLVRRRR